jgi:dUTP pyrophosphatase
VVTKEEVLAVLEPKDIVALLRTYRPNVKFVMVHPDAIEPDYAHLDDSGADLFSVEDKTVFPGETEKIDTGLVLALEEGWELQGRSKGGPASRSIWVANSPGTVDEGYRGRIFVLYHNGSKEVVNVKKGQKVAQAIVAMYWQADYECVADYQILSEGIEEGDNSEEVLMNRAIEALPSARSSRGAGALGSTGVHAGA